MAVSFPLPIADFFKDLGKTETTLTLPSYSSSDHTLGGDGIEVEYGNRLWVGSVSVRFRRNATADMFVAKMELLLGASGSFFVTHNTRIGPQLDPSGAILGAATPSIASVAANNRDITLSGLPANYALSAGDLISWEYGGRYSLHRIVDGVVADGSGQAVIEVYPFAPDGSAGQSVTLANPFCKAVVLKESYRPPSRGTLTSGFSFQWRQTLR